MKLFAAGGEEVLRRARGLPRSAYGGTLAHAGIGLMVIGIVATSAWQSERVVAMKPGDTTDIAGYQLASAASPPRRAPTIASRWAFSP